MRIQLKFGLMLALVAPLACDAPPPEGSPTKQVPLTLGSSALVCVTAHRTADVDLDAFEAVYEEWIETAEHRSGFVDSMLLRFEDGERFMFALVFDGENPDGMMAAHQHRRDESQAFATLLRNAGFSEISAQSNLRYVAGGEERVSDILF